MICNNCKEETEQGKFCTKCGAPLQVENAQESAAATEPTPEQNDPVTPTPVQQTEQQPQVQQQQQSVDIAEKTKEVSSNFGAFFMNALKKPSSAKQVNGTHFISGIISIVAFALIISIDKFMYWRDQAGEFGSKSDVSFFDYLVVPFLKYLLLYAIVVVLIFAATRVAQQTINIQDIVAKYGAYLVPFILLFVLSFILDLIDMTGLPFSVVGSIAMLGPILIIPILILSEKAVKGFDYIYTAIILVLLTYVAYRYIENSVNDIDTSFFDDFDWGW